MTIQLDKGDVKMKRKKYDVVKFYRGLSMCETVDSFEGIDDAEELCEKLNDENGGTQNCYFAIMEKK